jgi:uncharacterized damage-inducible protein DinB
MEMYMNAAYFRRLFDYNYWAHRRVWKCVMALTDEQFTRPSDYSIGSVHAQVVHTMGAEWLWLTRARGNPVPRIPPPEDYPTREAIRVRWDEIEREWRAYVEALTDVDLTRNIEYVSVSGNMRRVSFLPDALIQILNHSTDHRAQTLALIHQLGGETVEQDLIFYAWEHPHL